MILIEFVRDMRPSWRAGQSYLLPDEMALNLIVAGDARNPRDRLGNPLPPASDPDPQLLPPSLLKRRYQTKAS